MIINNMREVIIATKNKGKLREFESLLANLNVKVRSLEEFDSIPDIIEDGETFQDNAKKKAEEICKIFNLPTIADDSGLVVDFLNGMPGIYSARFAGDDKNDDKNNARLLELMQGIETKKRSAKFVCTIALAIPNEATIFVQEAIEGSITFEPKGLNGFGYDPLFYIPEYGKTMAEIASDVKNKISHRAKALEKLIIIINEKNREIHQNN